MLPDDITLFKNNPISLDTSHYTSKAGLDKDPDAGEEVQDTLSGCLDWSNEQIDFSRLAWMIALAGGGIAGPVPSRAIV